MTFRERLKWIIAQNNSLLCVGLDPDLEQLPSPLPRTVQGMVAFNQAIVEATADLVCAYKPNLAFYLVHGAAGIEALAATRAAIPPEIPVILDAKLGDIASTSAAYAKAIFETLGFDAVTVHPYLGSEALEPFLRARERGIFVLARTSNPGAGEFQDLPVGEGGDPLFLKVAERARIWNEQFGNVGLVVGATYPVDLAIIRQRCPDLPILAPGVGPQGGDLETVLRAGLAGTTAPLLLTLSRSILYADSGPYFAQVARQVATQIRQTIQQVQRAASTERPTQ